jgi:hypothetical protein
MKESTIYKLLKYFNDFKAVKKGKIKQRIENRLLDKFFGRFFV